MALLTIHYPSPAAPPPADRPDNSKKSPAR
jgi:hypothetical protein